MPVDNAAIRKEIGRRVARARADAGLSQWQLAEALDCNETTIGRLERGHSLPGVVFLLRVCDAVSLAPATLFDLELPGSDRKSAQSSLAARLRKADEEDFRLAERVLDRLLPKKTVKKRVRKR